MRLHYNLKQEIYLRFSNNFPFYFVVNHLPVLILNRQLRRRLNVNSHPCVNCKLSLLSVVIPALNQLKFATPESAKKNVLWKPLSHSWAQTETRKSDNRESKMLITSNKISAEGVFWSGDCWECYKTEMV